MPRSLQPHSPLLTTSGPTLRPSARLLEWLHREAAAQPGQRRRFRLPVVVRINPRWELLEAYIGVDAAPGPEPIELSLDDTLMGVSLMDSIGAQHIGDAQAHAFWLDGYWGPALEADTHDAVRGWPFAVLRVHEPIAPGSLNADSTHARVEVLAPTAPAQP